MTKVRGVRFSDEENRMIEEFLRKNPLIDFSTLAKLAIIDFMSNPEVELKPVKKRPEWETRHVRTDS